MNLRQESHDLYPADSDIFRVNNNKTRLILGTSCIYLLIINGFCQDCSENHMQNTGHGILSQLKTWMMTESHYFFSLNFLFLVYVYVCMFVYFIHVSIFTLTHVLFKFVKFIIYFILILILLLLLKKKIGFKIQEIHKQIKKLEQKEK